MAQFALLFQACRRASFHAAPATLNCRDDPVAAGRSWVEQNGEIDVAGSLAELVHGCPDFGAIDRRGNAGRSHILVAGAATPSAPNNRLALGPLHPVSRPLPGLPRSGPPL